MSAGLRAGYKQTEVGVIPQDWEALQIRDVCKLVNGRGFKPFEWQTAGLPIIRIQNLNGSEEFNYYSGQYNPKILVESGQLLFAWSGSRGTSFGPHVWHGERALLNYHTWKVVVNELSVTPDFLLHALRQLTSYIEDRAHGASALVPTQKWEMEKFPIVLPASLPEQRAIAAALSDVDALLGGLDRLIAKKLGLKVAAMQQLLTGQTRLPGFSGDWEVVRAGDIGRFQGGSGFPIRFQGATEGEYPLFKVSDMNNVGNEKFMETANNYISETLRKQLGATAFPAESIVFAKVGAAVFLERKKILNRTSCLDNNMAAFVMDASRAHCLFIHYVLLNTKLGSLVSTTALPSLSGSVLAAIELPLPPLSEQTAIAAILSDMDTELAALQERRAKIQALKQAMMQELLTGRIRLI